ncbi:ribosome silencing factor [Thermodesulfobacterium hveragerdense]|uniref:ribosome silencing factor n=1 Tax=Thermodesulfobacterium hveragerdense TaxID=53424 RepID=UPI0004901255|nr:ribosome silencing factor [Thermodesulfobacterium hveragerdense]
MESKVLAEVILNLLEDKKAENIVLIDVKDKVDYADYFIICSAHSTKHTQGLSDHVLFELEKIGIEPLGIEGAELGQWIILDFDSVIVHLFYEPIRQVYALEDLWMDFPLPRKQAQAPLPLDTQEEV